MSLRIQPIAFLLAGTMCFSAVAATAQTEGTLVVVNKGTATANLIDVASGRMVVSLPTGEGPHEVALSHDGQTAIVTDYGGQQGGRSLTVIDIVGKRVVRKVNFGKIVRPHGIVFLPGDSLVAVTAEAVDLLYIVGVADGSIRRSVPTGHPGSHMVAVTADGRLAYTSNGRDNTVGEIDLTLGRPTRSFAVPARPEAIAVTPDGSEVWVGGNTDGVVSIISPATGALSTPVEGLTWPYRVAFTPDLKTVLIPDLTGHTLRVIDRATRRVQAILPFPNGGPEGIVITPDGSRAFLSLSGLGTIVEIDLKTRKVVREIQAGPRPDGIVFSPLRIASSRR